MARIKKKSRKKRRKVDRSAMARKAQGGGGAWFKQGVKTWEPEEKGEYALDFIPYIVTRKDHPDHVSPGTPWSLCEFRVHHGVGPNNLSRVCPLSVGKRCPIHEDADRLESKKVKSEKLKEKNEKLAKELRGQGFVGFNIIDPEGSDEARVFAVSYGKFYGAEAGLRYEINEDPDNAGFFDWEEGKTVNATFKEKKFRGNKYFQCIKIEFEDRDDLDQEEWEEKAYPLDEILNVVPYDQLKAEYLGEEEEDDDSPRPKKKKKKRKIRRRSREEEDEEDEED